MMISLLGIMVVFYIESAGDLSNVGIDTAARKAQQDIRYAQQLAQTTGVVHGVKFIKNGTYQVYRGSYGNPVTDPTTGGQLVENFVHFPGVEIDTNYEVKFDAVGRPTIGADQRARLIATSGARRDVYVIDQTGAVINDLIQKGTGCSCDICRK